MKNGVLVCAAVLALAALVPAPVAAAVDFDLSLKVGFKAGVSKAKIREAYSEPHEVYYSDSLTRPVFGAFAAFNLIESVWIQPEIYLLTQGGKWHDDVPEIFLLSYIHVPVLTKVRLVYEGKFIPFFIAGPSLDILLSVRDKWYFEGEWHLWPLPVDYKSAVGGFVFGAGVEQMLDHFMLILDIRYHIGGYHIGTEGPHEWGTTRALMAMLGIGF